MRLGRGYPISRVVAHPKLIVQPLFDNSAASASQTNLATGTPFTFSHTVGSDPVYSIVVIAGNAGGASMNLSATCVVTFGGTALTELGNAYGNNNSAAAWMRVFGGFGVPTGGAQTVSVTLTQASRVFTGQAWSFTYTKVGSVGTLQSATVFDDEPGVNVSTQPGRRVFGAILADGTPTISNFSLTQRQIRTTDPSAIMGDAISTSTNMLVDLDLSISSNCASFGLDLIPPN